MITMMKVNEIEAKKGEDTKVSGFDVVFNLENVLINKDEVQIKFVYTANYKTNGRIRIKGELTATEDKNTIEKIETELKNKRLPSEYMQKIINTVNYFGTINATIIASIINLVPPIKMPELQLRTVEGSAPSKTG